MKNSQYRGFSQFSSTVILFTIYTKSAASTEHRCTHPTTTWPRNPERNPDASDHHLQSDYPSSYCLRRIRLDTNLGVEILYLQLLSQNSPDHDPFQLEGEYLAPTGSHGTGTIHCLLALG